MSEIISREELEKAFTMHNLPPVAYGMCFGPIFAAARAHLETLPRMKEIDVWHVEYASGPRGFGVPHLHAPFCLREDAERNAAALQRESYSFVRVTGHHKHQVPA